MKIESFSGEIISSLFDLGEWYLTAFTNPRLALYFGYNEFLDRQELAERWRVMRRLRILEQQKIIKIINNQNKILIRIEKNGRVAWLKREIAMKVDVMPGGMQILVSFDVPEVAARARDTFRRMLKDCGFRYRHRSVWVIDTNVTKEVIELVRLVKMRKWVSIYLVQKID